MSSLNSYHNKIKKNDKHKINKNNDKDLYSKKTHDLKTLSHKINISKESWLQLEMIFYKIDIDDCHNKENKRIEGVFKTVTIQ